MTVYDPSSQLAGRRRGLRFLAGSPALVFATQDLTLPQIEGLYR